MARIPTQKENPNGLHQRYIVSKSNGEPIDPDAIYFVLRIDANGDDEDHLEFCRDAARTYCNQVFRRFGAERASEKPILLGIASDLWVLLNDIEAELPD